MALEAKGGLGRLLLRHDADRERGAVCAARSFFRAAIIHATVQRPLGRSVPAPAHDVTTEGTGAEKGEGVNERQDDIQRPGAKSVSRTDEQQQKG